MRWKDEKSPANLRSFEELLLNNGLETLSSRGSTITKSLWRTSRVYNVLSHCKEIRREEFSVCRRGLYLMDVVCLFVFFSTDFHYQVCFYSLSLSYFFWLQSLQLPHPRRPRGSQSGREKRQNESFQVRAKEPLCTDSHRTISKNSSGCRFLIGHKKCFVLLCPIGQQFLLSSFREFVHDGYRWFSCNLGRHK